MMHAAITLCNCQSDKTNFHEMNFDVVHLFRDVHVLRSNCQLGLKCCIVARQVR